MSCNDPHLEAQMELDARHPRVHDVPPVGFARRQAWVLLGVVIVAATAWLVHVLIR